MATTPQLDPPPAQHWYSQVTRYHWLVLVLASAGWVFDVYEGQIFNITSSQILGELKPEVQPSEYPQYKNVALGMFLVGGAFGGVLCGMLADRHGRKPVLIWTIVVYSAFSGLTYFATEWWQVLLLRFPVAVGVAGAWSVAAALVAEVFPKQVRPYTSSIFHATSVLGTWLATAVAGLVGMDWRYAFLLGLFPAALSVMIGGAVRETADVSEDARTRAKETRGSLRELLFDPRYGSRAIGGLFLAAVGLGTFWAVTVYGQDLASQFLLEHGAPPSEASARAKIAYGYVQTAGGGLGLLAMGPLCSFLGRRRAFMVANLAAYAIVPVVCYVPQTYNQLLMILPVFGFFTLGIHAGYAIYFPELFPQRLRATGTGFCFNGGRLVAAIVLIASTWIHKLPNFDLRLSLVLLSQLFLVGVVIAWFMPETRNVELT